MIRAFKIWTGKHWRYFATLESARAAAGAIHRETGIIVAIEACAVGRPRLRSIANSGNLERI